VNQERISSVDHKISSEVIGEMDVEAEVPEGLVRALEETALLSHFWVFEVLFPDIDGTDHLLGNHN